MTPTTIDGYTVLRRISQTAGSELFLARDRRGREDIALKVILPEKARDKHTLREYRREVEVSQALDHPNLVKIYEFNEKAERPYLVMRYSEGQMLKRAIYRDHPLVIKWGFHWLVRAAQGLAHMHGRGYVHLDVKPENILVEEGGQAMVIDLAIARPFGKRRWIDSVKARFGGRTAGTRSYMSPEQIRNEELGPRADIYSLGVTIFEMYARRLPLTASDPDAILQLHLNAEPPRLRQVVPVINPGLSDLVNRMLAKLPEARPHSMEQVIDELARLGSPLAR